MEKGEEGIDYIGTVNSGYEEHQLCTYTFFVNILLFYFIWAKAFRL